MNEKISNPAGEDLRRHTCRRPGRENLARHLTWILCEYTDRADHAGRAEQVCPDR